MVTKVIRAHHKEMVSVSTVPVNVDIFNRIIIIFGLLVVLEEKDRISKAKNCRIPQNNDGFTVIFHDVKMRRIHI